jgi:hypothetical protein
MRWNYEIGMKFYARPLFGTLFHVSSIGFRSHLIDLGQPNYQPKSWENLVLI